MGGPHVCSYGDPHPCLVKDFPLWFVRGEGPTPLETILHLCSTKNPNKRIGSLERLLILPPSFSRRKNALICGWDLRRSAVTVFAFPRGRNFISNFLQRVGFLVNLFKDKSYQVFFMTKVIHIFVLKIIFFLLKHLFIYVHVCVFILPACACLAPTEAGRGH